MTRHGPWFVRLRRAASAGPEDGFTLIESVVAMGVFFAVIVGLLASLNTGVRGIVLGRQRTGAIAIANQLVETARAMKYGEVGHGTTGTDSTLATDSALTGCSTLCTYSGADGVQPLVGSTVPGTNPAGCDAAGSTLPCFNPHIRTVTKDGNTYTASVYITAVPQAAGSQATPPKRITVTVSWANSPYGAAVANRVKVTSLLFNASQPADPHLSGGVDSDAGKVLVSGTLNGVTLNHVDTKFAVSHADLDSSFIKTAHADGFTPNSQLDVVGQTVSACLLSSAGVGTCPSAESHTFVDNDSDTAPPENDAIGPVSDTSHSLSVAGVVSMTQGAGSTTSKSTVRSCFACFSTQIGDDDKLPYTAADASGPSGTTNSFVSGVVSAGVLYSTPTDAGTAATAAPRAKATIDRNVTTSNEARLVATSQTSTPRIDIATLKTAISGPTSMVYVDPICVQAIANSGEVAASGGTTLPSPDAGPCAGWSSMNVHVWNPLKVPAGYDDVPITPGSTSTSVTKSVVNALGLGAISFDATVTTVGKTASSTPPDPTECDGYQLASMNGWLRVALHLTIAGAADLTITLDLGGPRATACYKQTPAS